MLFFVWKYVLKRLFLHFQAYNDMAERLDYVDIAKGIGIVLVVCSHTDALSLMWLFMGMFVPLFYFCSGYTFSQKGTMVELMKKRLIKLLVPYVFFNILMFIAFWSFSLREFVGFFYSRYCLYPLNITPNIKFLTSGNYPMWFLTSMVTTYFLFLLLIYNERYKYVITAIYAILALVFTFCPILLPWSVDTAPFTALVMYAGYESRKHEFINTNVWKRILLAVIYVCLEYVGGDMNLSVRMYGTSVFIFFILAVSGSLIVLWLSKYLQGTPIGRLFVTLGQHSLTIFCVEIAFIVMAKDIYRWALPNVELGYIAGFWEIIIALLGGWMFSVLIHNNKILSKIVYVA
jgi:fucose 4-O-acetylase-like acetyltransferase